MQAHTRTLWGLLKRYAIPVFLFINKMDQPAAQEETLMAQLKERLAPECVNFTKEGKPEFYEEIATASERALDMYLETGEVEEGEIRRLVSAREVFPCFFGSALKSTGVEAFLQGLCRYTKTPVYEIGRASCRERV